MINLARYTLLLNYVLRSKKNNKMKVLFVIRSATTFHYFSSTVRELCQKGHEVHVLFDSMRRSRQATREPMDNIQKEFKNFSYDFAKRRGDYWLRPLTFARELLSCHRHLVSTGQADFWRVVQTKYLPIWLQPYLVRRDSWVNRIIQTKTAAYFFRLVERMAPPDPEAITALKKMRPDVVLASPTNFSHSSADLEYLKAARALSIPTVIPVLSWDNLTVRGAFHIMPDFMLVWNQEHVKEAVGDHGIPRERIRITGAPFFDNWFTKLTPSLSREEFARLAGIASEDPYILWLGSPKNIAEDESWLLLKYKEAFEKSRDPRLQKIQIILRPHPLGFRQFETLKHPGIVIFPRGGERTSTQDARERFYNSLRYAVAAVHINTSAIVDAIIADTPAITALDERYRHSQEETKHFRDLAAYNAFEKSRSPEECVKEVDKILQGRDEHAKERRAFVGDFIRPRSLDIPAGRVAAQEVENLLSNK